MLRHATAARPERAAELVCVAAARVATSHLAVTAAHLVVQRAVEVGRGGRECGVGKRSLGALAAAEGLAVRGRQAAKRLAAGEKRAKQPLAVARREQKQRQQRQRGARAPRRTPCHLIQSEFLCVELFCPSLCTASY